MVCNYRYQTVPYSLKPQLETKDSAEIHTFWQQAQALMSIRQNSFDDGTTGAGKSESDMESRNRFIAAKIRCTEVWLCLVRASSIIFL
jgi:hypothetical protein